MIHSLGGVDYSVVYTTEFIILRQIINFAVVIFIVMSGYFWQVDKIIGEEFSYKK